MKSISGSLTFRPLPKVAEQLEYADRIGLQKSKVINAVLSLHLKEWLQAKRVEQRKMIEELLKSPVP